MTIDDGRMTIEKKIHHEDTKKHEERRVLIMEYKYTDYFLKEVLWKRPYIDKKWCIEIIENPIKEEEQDDNRCRFWGKVEQLAGRILRVVTLSDKKTIHNAFPDRSFKL